MPTNFSFTSPLSPIAKKYLQISSQSSLGAGPISSRPQSSHSSHSVALSKGVGVTQSMPSTTRIRASSSAARTTQLPSVTGRPEHRTGVPRSVTGLDQLHKGWHPSERASAAPCTTTSSVPLRRSQIPAQSDSSNLLPVRAPLPVSDVYRAVTSRATLMSNKTNPSALLLGSSAAPSSQRIIASAKPSKPDTTGPLRPVKSVLPAAAISNTSDRPIGGARRVPKPHSPNEDLSGQKALTKALEERMPPVPQRLVCQPIFN